MAYQLSDTFIGNFPQTQGFGDNPAIYKKFGINGHDGIDLGCPSNTQVVSTADGWVKEVGSDPNGYGNYVKIIHNKYLSLYGHLDHAVVKVNDKVVQGQLIGVSDNTGNSTGAHLHFGVAPCDTNGEKTEGDNGYAGYIDPNGSRCKWTITNLSTPVAPQNALQQVSVDGDTFTRLVTKSTIEDKVVEKLKVENNETIVLAELDKLIGYEDAVAQKDKQLGDAQAKVADLDSQLAALQAQNADLQKANDTFKAQVQEQADQITKQAFSIGTLTENINDLKAAIKMPVFSGWKAKLVSLIARI